MDTPRTDNTARVKLKAGPVVSCRIHLIDDVGVDVVTVVGHCEFLDVQVYPDQLPREHTHTWTGPPTTLSPEICRRVLGPQPHPR